MRRVDELDIVTYAFFCDGTSDGRALHFTLRVDYDTGVVLKPKVEIRESEMIKDHIPQSRGRHRPFGAMPYVGG